LGNGTKPKRQCVLGIGSKKLKIDKTFPKLRKAHKTLKKTLYSYSPFFKYKKKNPNRLIGIFYI
jgi:hypothetical protein